jgi:hypothetical protein
MNAAAVTAAAPRAATAVMSGLVQWKCHQRLARATGLGGVSSGSVAGCPSAMTAYCTAAMVL